MNKKEVDPRIDFADSDFRSFAMDEHNNLVIYIDSWEEKLIKIIFSKVIYFMYSGGFQITGVYETINSTLNKVIGEYYETYPEKHPYKLFQIENLSHQAFIEIVAVEATIIEE